MKIRDIKRKVAKKIVKVQKKITKKCGTEAKALLFVTASVFSLVLAGCGSYPAAYSVTQNNEFKGCNFTFGPLDSTTNSAPVEMFTLAQNLENKGSQAADQKSTNEIKPDTDVNVGGVGGGKGLLEQAAGALLTPGASKTESSGCPGGNCSECTYGSCSE